MLGQALHLAAAQRRNVLVDLTRCDFIDSTVVSLLLAAHVEVSSDGGEFAVVIPPPPSPVARTAKIMGLAEMFPTYSSREDAEARTEHVVRIRDLRARFGDAESFAAECSCGWSGERHAGENAKRAVRQEARLHADTRGAGVRNGPTAGR
jgi:anti-anti-sigma factor